MGTLFKLSEALQDLAVWWARVTGRVHESEVWNLDVTIAKFALPRFDKWFEQGVHGYPSSHDSYEAWMTDLKKIRHAMAVIAREDPSLPYDEEWDKVQERCELFGKYFLALWD